MIDTLELFNSSCPWATTLEDLKALYNSPYTTRVTTRTSLLEGFQHDDSIHKSALFVASTHTVGHEETDSSLNTYGYSPYTLREYLDMIRTIYQDEHRDNDKGNGGSKSKKKPFIISITGSPEQVVECYKLISTFSQTLGSDGGLLSMEINLSCPNITNKPPPAYDGSSLHAYLLALQDYLNSPESVVHSAETVKIGIKTPPYTYTDQFTMLISTLSSVSPTPISFITSTNTLGSSLLFSITDTSSSESLQPTLPSEDGSGIGGLAGASIHPLSLGNVYRIRKLLDESQRHDLKNIQVVGVGGVSDGQGYLRMRKAGAGAVALATGLGRLGVKVFENIVKDVKHQKLIVS